MINMQKIQITNDSTFDLFSDSVDDSSFYKTSNIKNPNEKTVKKDIPWIEKYRPSNVDEIVDQKNVIDMLNSSIDTNNLPHLLFYGPPGTGKTSTILAIARKIYGKELMKSRIVELNASDERGINAVRQKIKTFAKASLKGVYNEEKKLVPPYKIIILDEADSMTTDAQSALRKIMEDTCHVTRFCFICNYIDKMLDAIVSRCSTFKFSQLNPELMKDKLIHISKQEGMQCDNEIYKTIIKISNGDMRRAIMTLQNMKYYISIYDKQGKKITTNDILEITGYQSDKFYKKIYHKCVKKDLNEIINLARSIYLKGYPINNILVKINEINHATTLISDYKKALITISFGTIQKRLIEGSNEYLEILNILTIIHKIANDKTIKY
jgi:replication factor C subunit 2/4